jgi:hypothetical protein
MTASLSGEDQQALQRYLLERQGITEVGNWDKFVVFLTVFRDKRHWIVNVNSAKTALGILSQLLDKDEVLRQDIVQFAENSNKLQIMATQSGVEDSNVFRRNQREVIAQQVALISKIVAHFCSIAGIELKVRVNN